MRLDDVPEPAATAQRFAIIEVSRCGICGTDLAELRYGPVLIRRDPHPLSGQAPPITLGHELVGVLRSGTSPDGAIRPGARVTVDACLRCERCPACLRGNYHLCRYGGAIGLHSDGAFAPLAAVPGYSLVEVPDGVTDDQAALSEPFAVALHGLERAALTAADRVLVLGFGPIGAACALVARALGGEPLVVEVNQQRRAVADHLGIATIDAGADLPRRVRRVLGGGGAEIVVEATGTAELVPLAVDCATRGGRIVLLGLGRDAAVVDPKKLTLYERSLLGTLAYRHDLPRVLALTAAGALDPAVIIGATIPLAEAPSVMADMAHRPGAAIKILVDPTVSGSGA